jgi:exodeoxyribonuclease-1
MLERTPTRCRRFRIHTNDTKDDVMTQTFYWHDYETWGANPARSRASQFAGIRTDEELNEIGEPLMIYCQPVIDVLPEPEACLITGITPQHAQQHGVIEAEFIKQIHAELNQPGTCGVGYNSLRFDDEFTRHTLWRNFYDPYEREYKNGNSRFDLIDAVRMCAALRPEGINWPLKEDGTPSFKLEHLTAANGIVHEGAHDALVDVRATIALARLLKKAQPKLFDYALSLRDKRKAAAMLSVAEQKPLLHFSEKFPATQYCGAMIIPLALHPVISSNVICYDLNQDPSALLELDVEKIKQRLYTPRDQLPEGVERIALKSVRSNRCPMLAPISLLDEAATQRMAIDRERCRENYDKLKAAGFALVEKIQAVFSANDRELPGDPELSLYSGSFLSPADKALCTKVQRSKPDDLATLSLPFKDKRLTELLFRYRARNFPATLSTAEQQQWQAFVRAKLIDGQDGNTTIASIKQRIAALSPSALNDKQQDVLQSLLAYLNNLTV